MYTYRERDGARALIVSRDRFVIQPVESVCGSLIEEDEWDSSREGVDHRRRVRPRP